jgi:hypothetical protein
LVFLFSFSGAGQDRLKQMRSTVIEKINGKDYYIHTVKRGQTLYMISKAYNVEVDDIIRENPEVKEGLKSEQKLKIPAPGSRESSKKQQKQPIEEKPAPAPVPQQDEESVPCGSVPHSPKTTWNVALMIPLYLNEVGQMDVDAIVKSGNTDAHPLQFIEFYEGALLALDSLKRTGISLKLTVYDVTRDTLRIKKILKDPEMKKMDLIIGLLYNRPFRIVADYAQKNNIPLANPLSEREQIVQGYSRVIKVQPSSSSEVSQVVQNLSEDFADANIIVLIDGALQKDAADNLVAGCRAKNLAVNFPQGYESAMEKFSREKENVIVSFSDNKSWILDHIAKFNEWRNDYRITVFGLPRWDKIEDLGDDYLVNLKTRIVVPNFIDYSDTITKKFVRSFQDRYRTDPDLIAFQGFDVTRYFITALARFGRTLGHCLPEFHMQGLQADFHFTATKGNGYVNENWEIYYYDGYTLRKAGSQLK